MKDPSQIAVRLTPTQIAWLDRAARERQTSRGETAANRSGALREVLAWAMSENFFGFKKEKGKP